MTESEVSIDESLLESAARCLDEASVSSLSALRLDPSSDTRLQSLAEKANEGLLTADEAREYSRFIELSDILAALRLKAGRRFVPHQ